MGFGGVLLALSAVQAVSQIGQGYAEKAEADLNATIIEGKAGLIDVQKATERDQFNRLAGKTLSESYAIIGASGFASSGSFINVMIDTQKQIRLDEAVGQFNLDMEKRYTMAQAESERRRGKMAVRGGYRSAFSTMLSGASNYAMYRGFTTAGTPRNTIFDTTYKPIRGSLPKRNPAGYLGPNW